MNLRSFVSRVLTPLSFALTLLSTFGFTNSARANVCGTDLQNFNPTTSGLDFVTVHSSETLQPCVMNLGVFVNYAANTLSYGQNVLGTDIPTNTKANDRILGLDLSLGVGLTKRWDVGLSFPAILSQELKDNYDVTHYKETGFTDFRINTKFRFFGDQEGGLAAVLSMNNNLIKNNPFHGEDGGPTYNLEIAWDTLLSDWAIGLNLGHRWRDSGDPIPNQPFLPLKNQWIYSGAGSYYLESWDSKLILEVFGSLATKKVDFDANRSLNSLEWLIGLKHDFSNQVAGHAGAGTSLGDNIGGPDWRVYAGVNWALGPICDDEEEDKPEYTPAPIETEPEIFTFKAAVLFATNSDDIREDYARELEELAQGLQKTGFDKLQIDGHTDSLGDAEYNLNLSIRRAKSVKDYLVRTFQLPAEKIFTEGYGESTPVADNGNYQGRQQNRRVEFKIWRTRIKKSENP